VRCFLGSERYANIKLTHGSSVLSSRRRAKYPLLVLGYTRYCVGGMAVLMLSTSVVIFLLFLFILRQKSSDSSNCAGGTSGKWILSKINS